MLPAKYLLVVMIGIPLVTTHQATAQQYLPSRVNAFSASAESAAYFDAQRLQAVRNQIAWIDQIQWYNSYPLPGVGASYNGNPPSLDYVYAAGRRVANGAPSIFEPWPFVPGDIWGYPWYPRVRQPIARREIQTGPNRWESFPIYAPDPPAVRSLAPIVDVPISSPPPPAARPRGPRQF